MKGIVDKIEDDIVVLEINNGLFNLNKKYFPKDIKEGDIVSYDNDKFKILEDETKNRENQIKDLFNSLINNTVDL